MGSFVAADPHRYTITYMLPGDRTPQSKTVPAAYFVEDGKLTILKDERHQAVFAVHTDAVVSVSRDGKA